MRARATPLLSPAMGDLVFKICSHAFWRKAEAAGRYGGAPVDVARGYIHLSTGMCCNPGFFVKSRANQPARDRADQPWEGHFYNGQ